MNVFPYFLWGLLKENNTLKSFAKKFPHAPCSTLVTGVSSPVPRSTQAPHPLRITSEHPRVGQMKAEESLMLCLTDTSLFPVTFGAGSSA